MSNYKKYIFTAAGVFIFLMLGMFTMFFDIFIKSKKSAPISDSEDVKIQISEAPVQEPDEPEKIAISSDKTDKTAEKSEWYVYVTGAVKNPGVYKLSQDSRIFHAVDAAGGFTDKADRTSINLAQRLIDGFQINVSEKTEKIQKTSEKINTQTVKNIPLIIPGTPPKKVNTVNTVNVNTVKNSENRIDINSASEKELEKLNGVGPAIAKRIVEYRKNNGRFTSPKDLINVKGIGDAKLKKMLPQIFIR